LVYWHIIYLHLRSAFRKWNIGTRLYSQFEIHRTITKKATAAPHPLPTVGLRKRGHLQAVKVLQWSVTRGNRLLWIQEQTARCLTSAAPRPNWATICIGALFCRCFPSDGDPLFLLYLLLFDLIKPAEDLIFELLVDSVSEASLVLFEL